MVDTERVGFMQGRLSEPVNGKIQAFPWDHWRSEFATARTNGFGLMEWTLDQERLRENPLMTPEGRAEIRALAQQYRVRILSLTGDCLMQAPFYKTSHSARCALLDDFKSVIAASADLGVRYIVFPLVDNGRLEDERQEQSLIAGLRDAEPMLRDGMKILFESDYPPAQLRDFIAQLPSPCFGINYDIGNSAALGFDPVEEIEAYGERIDNVHVKDRVLHGTTVPLGTGNADFPAVFRALRRREYVGNFILQTARAANGDHASTLRRYRDMVVAWLQAA